MHHRLVRHALFQESYHYTHCEVLAGAPIERFITTVSDSELSINAFLYEAAALTHSSVAIKRVLHFDSLSP